MVQVLCDLCGAEVKEREHAAMELILAPDPKYSPPSLLIEKINTDLCETCRKELLGALQREVYQLGGKASLGMS